MTSEIKAIGSLSSQLREAPQATTPTATTTGVSFAEKLAAQPSQLQNLFGNDLHRDIQKLSADLAKGKEIPARDLLIYQMKVGAFNQRVELVSKLAESAMATLRKFQQQQ